MLEAGLSKEMPCRSHLFAVKRGHNILFFVNVQCLSSSFHVLDVSFNGRELHLPLAVPQSYCGSGTMFVVARNGAALF